MTLGFKTRIYSRIENNSDDASQSGTTVNTSGSLVSVSSLGDLVGLRFLNIRIPIGATITRAQFRVYLGSGNDDAHLQIHCQKDANPSTFTTASNNIGSRTLTDAFTPWVENDLGTGVVVLSPNFASAVQEVVDLGGWAPDNALAVILKGTGSAGFSIRSRDNSESQRATLIIEYTMPVPMRPTIHAIYQTTLKSTSSRSLSVPIPTAGGTRLYAFVHSIRIAANNLQATHEVTSATLHGTEMTHLDTQANNVLGIGYHLVGIYEVIDPLNNGPSTQTLSVTFDKTVSSMAITVVIVTGVTERGEILKEGQTPQVSDISLEVETDHYPGLILAAGHMRRQGTPVDEPHATDDAGVLTQYATGTATQDLIVFLGGAPANEPDTHLLGWNWTTIDWSPGGANAIMMAFPLYGTVEIAEADASGFDPVVVYGDATMDGLLAAASASAADPVVIVGSIPPVQVSGRGALFNSTASRTLTVCLLATNDDDWVITDNGGDVEQLSVRITRRSGYLTPV